MIKQHKSLQRSERIIKSLIDRLNKQLNGIDGIYEVFMNNGHQGYVLKILHTFDADSDICIWAYESLKDNMIETIIGKRTQCNEFNSWDSTEKLTNKRYKVTKEIQSKVVDDLFDYIKQHYAMDISLKI